MTNSRWRYLVGLILVVSLVAAACGRDDDSGGDSSSDTTSAPDDTGGSDDGGDEAAGPASASDCENYDGTQGVSDDAIKIGVSLPLSGVFAGAFASIEKGYQAYIDSVNADGGVRGREIQVTAKDDEYVPGNTIANYEELTQSDQVFALFNMVGTPNNLAIRDQQNEDCIPNLFLATGFSGWGDPDTYPWTIGSIPPYSVEMAALTEYLEDSNPQAKVAVLYQNDDFGKDYLTSLEGLVEGTDIEIVAKELVDAGSTEISSQINALAGSGADTFVLGATALACPTALGSVQEVGWDPLTYISATCTSDTLVGLSPPGSVDGAISAFYYKDPIDPQWADDPGLEDFRTVGPEYGLSAEDLTDALALQGWFAGELLVETLDRAADLTREDAMNSAWHLQDLELGALLPGIVVNTDGANDPYPIESMQIGQYDGTAFVLQGDLITFEGEAGAAAG